MQKECISDSDILSLCSMSYCMALCHIPCGAELLRMDEDNLVSKKK